jgi:hypothetical protein
MTLLTQQQIKKLIECFAYQLSIEQCIPLICAPLAPFSTDSREYIQFLEEPYLEKLQSYDLVRKSWIDNEEEKMHGSQGIPPEQPPTISPQNPLFFNTN